MYLHVRGERKRRECLPKVIVSMSISALIDLDYRLYFWQMWTVTPPVSVAVSTWDFDDPYGNVDFPESRVRISHWRDLFGF